MRFCGIKTTHDGAVALVDDGRLVFSYESEKVGNRGRYAKIEDLADVEAMLASFGYALDDLDAVVFDGWHKTRKVRRWHGTEVELTLGPYRQAMLSDALMTPCPGRVLDLDYVSFSHYAGHVAASYATSPFAGEAEPALVLSWDGLMYPYLYDCSSELAKVETVGVVFPLIGNAYPILAGSFPPFADRADGLHNLGLAGKIMAYAALGTPREDAVRWIGQVVDRVHASVVEETPFGEEVGFQLEAGVEKLTALAPDIQLESVSPPDMIASVDRYMQQRLVDSLVALVEDRQLAHRNLCLAGGTALNINWNRALRECGRFDAVWVPPFPNDSGAAIGAACCAMAVFEGRSVLEWDVYSGPLLGHPELPPGWVTRTCSLGQLAQLLHDPGEPVVVLTGRAELGPRALGHRSILAPATDPGMHDRLNEMKGREAYRPIAPVCLESDAPDVFDPGTSDPFMLFNHHVRPAWRDRIPAVCHVDGSSRLQTVNEREDPGLAELLAAYRQVSGIPLLCNTSANMKDRGFFPDVGSALRWGRADHVWSEGTLYSRSHR